MLINLSLLLLFVTFLFLSVVAVPSFAEVIYVAVFFAIEFDLDDAAHAVFFNFCFFLQLLLLLLFFVFHN